MRPAYETEADRENELAIGAALKDAWGVVLAKTPPKCAVDFMAFDQCGMCALIEVKQRNVTIATYPTIILSLHKVCEGVKLAEITGRPFYFVVQMNDGIFYRQIEGAADCDILMGGRSDRNDPQDMEPVVHFPRLSFQRL